jgi:ribonuclease PH
MRIDGRVPDALRPVRIDRHFTKFAPGSVLIAFGDTKVLCTAVFEEQIPHWRKESGKGWVTAEYAMLPGSSPQRVRRDQYNKGRSQEISRLIGRALRAVVDFDALGPCMITLDCDVLQADGGTRTAAITGAYVALYDALQNAVDRGFLKSIPLLSACAAVSVGLVDGEPLLDLCYAEDSRAGVDLNVVMDDQGQFIEVQGCAEGKPFSRPQMDALLDLAAQGTQTLLAEQRRALQLV